MHTHTHIRTTASNTPSNSERSISHLVSIYDRQSKFFGTKMPNQYWIELTFSSICSSRIDISISVPVQCTFVAINLCILFRSSCFISTSSAAPYTVQCALPLFLPFISSLWLCAAATRITTTTKTIYMYDWMDTNELSSETTRFANGKLFFYMKASACHCGLCFLWVYVCVCVCVADMKNDDSFIWSKCCVDVAVYESRMRWTI